MDDMEISVPLVQRLVAEQFPQWAHLPIRSVEISGHDNWTFRLGNGMSVRLPSAQRYAAHVATEQIWLPKLAPHLPLPIPVPLALGAPAHGYPWHWSINTWLDGDTAAVGQIDDPVRFAESLADFLNALRRIDARGAPVPGPGNFFRGGDLAVYDAETRGCIDELRDVIDTQAVTAVWKSALDAPWQGPAVWLHGDVAAGNLLVKDGRLAAVIDFGQLAAGDPACDVTIAWTFLSTTGREAFRRRLAVDVATWVRGRGWGVWKALLALRTYRRTNRLAAARAQRVVDTMLAESARHSP